MCLYIDSKTNDDINQWNAAQLFEDLLLKPQADHQSMELKSVSSGMSETMYVVLARSDIT